jgi:hypothetical protein
MLLTNLCASQEVRRALAEENAVARITALSRAHATDVSLQSWYIATLCALSHECPKNVEAIAGSGELRYRLVELNERWSLDHAVSGSKNGRVAQKHEQARTSARLFDQVGSYSFFLSNVLPVLSARLLFFLMHAPI